MNIAWKKEWIFRYILLKIWFWNKLIRHTLKFILQGNIIHIFTSLLFSHSNGSAHSSWLVLSPHLYRMKSSTRASCEIRYCPTVYLGSGRKVWGKSLVSDSPHGISSMLPRETGASPTICCPSFLPRVSVPSLGPPWKTTSDPYRPISMPTCPGTIPWT